MELTPISCPKCGGAIQLPPEKGAFYCMYCGTQLAFDDGSITVTHRTVDEARMKEIALEEKRLLLEEEKRPGRVKTMVTLAIIGASMMILGYFLGHASGDSDSPWFMVSLLGYFPLMAVPIIWASDRDR